MKSLKTILIITILLCISINLSHAQKMYLVHVDYVNPSKLMEYNKIAKDFTDACKKYNPEGSWITAVTSDNRYMYVSPLENFAELDKNTFSDMAKAMGDDFGKMFKDFNTCYDKHGDFVITLDESLSYMPEGITQTQEGQNYRKYYFIYYKPQDQAALREAMKGVKGLFSEKGSKEYYRVYQSGFGVINSYYMVAISAKDEADSSIRGKANDELLGEGAKDVFGKVMSAAAKFEEVSGWIRPDLAYSSK
ncbi:hypothetical protein V8G69_15850 [Gaetbulibacter sp. M235]|uniref:hypothetical protein n=1 Tax=Gaetbulibacter sp. M235 TaxID=3126510 RepID=UPI00374E7621